MVDTNLEDRAGWNFKEYDIFMSPLRSQILNKHRTGLGSLHVESQ
jgi:hypothetical protein